MLNVSLEDEPEVKGTTQVGWGGEKAQRGREPRILQSQAMQSDWGEGSFFTCKCFQTTRNCG